MIRTLFRVPLLSACLLVWGAAAAGAGQSPPKPPANDDCLACHDRRGRLIGTIGPTFGLVLVGLSMSAAIG